MHPGTCRQRTEEDRDKSIVSKSLPFVEAKRLIAKEINLDNDSYGGLLSYTADFLQKALNNKQSWQAEIIMMPVVTLISLF